MQKARKIGLLVLVMFLWGTLAPFTKLGYESFQIDTSFLPNVILFAGIRFVVCGAVITAIEVLTSAKKRTERIEKRALWLVFTAGLFSVVLHYGCNYIGLTVIDSSEAVLVNKTAGRSDFYSVFISVFQRRQIYVEEVPGCHMWSERSYGVKLEPIRDPNRKRGIVRHCCVVFFGHILCFGKTCNENRLAPGHDRILPTIWWTRAPFSGTYWRRNHPLRFYHFICGFLLYLRCFYYQLLPLEPNFK